MFLPLALASLGLLCSITGILIVKYLAKTQSRLTNGKFLNIPIKYYTITYLYKDYRKMIRGYHGIKTNAFY